MLEGAVGSRRSASGWRNADEEVDRSVEDALCVERGGGAVEDLEVLCGMKRSDCK